MTTYARQSRRRPRYSSFAKAPTKPRQRLAIGIAVRLKGSLTALLRCTSNYAGNLVDEKGFEPSASSMRTRKNLSQGVAPQSLRFFEGFSIGLLGQPTIPTMLAGLRWSSRLTAVDVLQSTYCSRLVGCGGRNVLKIPSIPFRVEIARPAA